MSSGILNCRFYRAKFPAPDELVMVTIKQIEDMGAYVQLLEYNNIEGKSTSFAFMTLIFYGVLPKFISELNCV